MIIKVTTMKVYKFKHLVFDFHDYLGPGFLRHKDFEPKSQQFRPMRDYGVLNQWEKLSKEDREKFRI